MTNSLTKDQMLAMDDRPIESVDVPEWGDSVFLKVMSGTERDAFEASNLRRTGKTFEPNLANVRAKLLVRCICSEDGQRLFADTDAGALGQKSAAALDRLYEAAARMNGITDADIEELEGNSGTGGGASDGSGSA